MAGDGRESVSDAPPLLLGTYEPRLDAKGRLTLPARFRPRFAGGLVMTRGQERCVAVLPADEFRRMAERVGRMPAGDGRTRGYLRVLLSGAVDQRPDGQGRVLVPPMLRRYAGLGTEVVVIGVGTRAEIWGKEAWEAYLADQEEGFASVSEDVVPRIWS